MAARDRVRTRRQEHFKIASHTRFTATNTTSIPARMIRSAVSSLSGAVVSPLRLASSSSRCSPSSSCRSSSVATFSTTTHSQKARAVIGYSLPFHVPKPASAPKTLSTLGSPSPKSAEVIYNKHPGPSFGLQTPKDFLDAISYPPRRILSENSELVGAIGESWDEMFHVDGPKLRKAGVEPKVRK